MPDTKEQATPTPRTDREIWLLEPDTNFKDSYKHMASFARQLETELAEANQRLAAMEEDAKRLDWLDDWGYEYDGLLERGWGIGLPENQKSNTRSLRAAIDAARLQQREGGK